MLCHQGRRGGGGTLSKKVCVTRRGGGAATKPQAMKSSASHPIPRVDFTWIGLILIETLVNIGLLRFRWFSLSSWMQLGWAFAEVVRFFSSLFKAFQLLMPIKRAPLNLDELLDRKDFPTVDIMVPCYNEPLPVRSQSRGGICNWSRIFIPLIGPCMGLALLLLGINQVGAALRVGGGRERERDNTPPRFPMHSLFHILLPCLTTLL